MSFADALERHLRVFAALPQLEPAVVELAADIERSLREGGKLVLFGNGGSAADSQHIAAEFVVRYRTNRRALPAIALTTDTSVLTAQSNDFGFEHVFSRQVEALCGPADTVIGISTSGTSPNVVNGLHAARRVGARTWGWTGGRDGAMTDCCDRVLAIPDLETARIQEAQLFIGHWICEEMDRRFANP